MPASAFDTGSSPVVSRRRSFVEARLDGMIRDAIDPDGVALADLSLLPRGGYKGRDTGAWLTGRGLPPGEAPNTAYPASGGWRLARLSAGEVLLLGGLDGDGALLDDLAAAWTADSGLCFPVPRQDSHAWFVVLGQKAPQMLAKLCAVDLRPRAFADGAIAQTSLARLSAIVIRRSLGGVPGFDILADSASALYLWDCLTDAMAEFGGIAPIGLDAVARLENTRSGSRIGGDILV